MQIVFDFILIIFIFPDPVSDEESCSMIVLAAAARCCSALTPQRIIETNKSVSNELFFAFTCSKMQGCWFAPSHVFGVHIHDIYEFLHPRNVPVSTGFKQLPERSVPSAAAAAAAARVPAVGVGRGTGAGLAALRGGRGASAAAADAAAARREGRSWGGGGGRGRCCLTVSDAFHCCSSAGKRGDIFGGCRGSAGRGDGERGPTGSGGQQLLLLLRGATRRRHFHNNPHQQQNTQLTTSCQEKLTSGQASQLLDSVQKN